MQPPQFTDGFIFWVLAALAAFAGLFAVWLIMRARRPARSISAAHDEEIGFASHGLINRLDRYWRRVAEVLRQLGARGEWRYRIPWVVICGDAGAGRSSLIASVRVGRNEQIGKREEKLPIAGTRWSFFDAGVVIDLDEESLPDPASDNRRWNEVLGELIDRRPERPLDGVVLTLSARTLLHGSRAEVQRMAERCHVQLAGIQERCEFILPVYVVVTQCDAVEGFTAFWQAQPEKHRREMFGWSNPCALDNAFAPQWMDDAFGYLGGALKRLQLQAAAAERTIENPDEFFLLPQRFQALKANVASVLSHLFRASVYRATPFFRGVYFVGSAAEAAADAVRPRADVAFVEELFTEKIFAEQNLARPLRQALWSRHVLTRRLQYGAAALGAVLYLSLVNAGMGLSHQVDVGVTSVGLIRHPQYMARGNGGCIDKQTVYELLSNISLLNVDITFLTIPASWVDPRIRDSGLRLVADEAFKEVIFPGFACQLEHHAKQLLDGEVAHEADELTDDRERLRQYLDQALALEGALARFRRLAVRSTRDQSAGLVPAMDKLVQYLYGEPLPRAVRSSGSYFRTALAQVEYLGDPASSFDLHGQAANDIERLSLQARNEISDEVSAGEALLDALSKERPPLLQNAQRFDRWLKVVRNEWMASSRETNPCSVVSAALAAKLGVLIGTYGYAKSLLTDVAARFEPTVCYEPELRRLAQLHVAPDTMLFKPVDGQLQLTPQIEREAEGLARIMSLDSMQLAGGLPFSCQLPVLGWKGEQLEAAAAFIREYHAFADPRQLAASQVALPLYARVLRRQLQSVLDEIMSEAQVTATAAVAPGVAALDSLAASEQALAQQSTQLLRIYPSLIAVLQQYDQLGFDSARRVAQCARQYAADALRRLSWLEQGSGLYEVQTAHLDEGSNGLLFTFGAEPQINDYLTAQFQRAQVLASYAGPLVSLLQNTDSGGVATLPSVPGVTYWDNTRREVSRVIQFKDTQAQAALLSDFVAKRMAALTMDDCVEQLASYTSPASGDDVFSRRRISLERQAHWTCYDRERALAITQYQRWARRFDRELAGKFPFAGRDATQDASLLVTRNFFVDYNEEREALRKKLAWVKEQGLGEVAQFLDRLDEAAQLFGAAAATEPLPPLRLVVEFRALSGQSPPAQSTSGQSTGAENIVSWRLQTHDAAATFPNGPAQIDWRYAQQVAFVATWADLAPVTPQADPKQADMRVDGDVVSFSAEGAWALLRMIQRHRPASAPRTDALGQGVAVLEFNVPTQDKRQRERISHSRFFIALKLSVIDSKTQAPVAVRWPGAFPVAAPSVW